jgi:UDP-glucose 4-epimerase
MKISLTGASGFIGNHLLTKLWDDGHEVMKWDRKSGRDIKDWELEGCDFVVHLAADADVRRSILEPDLDWDNNVETTKRIQEICRVNQVPLVYASSSCIHAWHKSPYGISKRVNEITAYTTPFGVNNQVGLRFTTVYGDGARDTMFMGKLMRGEVKYATNHVRDFIHVDDVVKAIMIFINTGTKGKLPAYDVGTGTGHIVSKLAQIKYPNIEIREGDDCEAQDNTADNSDLRALGWEPTINARGYVQNNGNVI